MTKYLFILGRNPELSVLELKSFFKRTGNSVNDIQRRENAVLVDLENTLDAGVVDLLGGTISIGVVLCEIKDIDRKEIYFSEKNNFSYGLWDFSDREGPRTPAGTVSEYLKQRFRREKLKASEKKIREDVFLQDKSVAGNFRSKTIDEEYFVFDNYFGSIVQKCDYKGIEKRDMNKPVRRESLSISPRLAKIMINLSEVPEGGKILDGFCGIGVVLIEALNQGFKVVGVDKDEKAISGARENLKHFDFSSEDYNLINFDSSKISLKDKDIFGLVSEPDFGETLKKIPTPDKAKEMVKRYERIIVSVLRNLEKYVVAGGRFVITLPYIRTVGKKRVGCDVAELEEKVGLKVVDGFPVDEFREGQIVGRQIVVFSK